MSNESRQELSLSAFAQLLRAHCHGDWWENVPPLSADPQWGACEACGYHPCTTEQAEVINALFARLRHCGAPSPSSCYPHCCGDVLVEWHSEGNENSIVLDVFNPFGRDALVRVPPAEIYFVNVAQA